MSDSASSSASSSRSASLEPVPLAKNNKSKAAQKAKAKSNAAAPEAGRNAGDDPHWAYKPPGNTVQLDESADVGDFDWDALNGNDDLELWLVRIPDGVKPKYLESAQLELPSTAARDSTKTARMGMLQRKHVGYDVWSVGDNAPDPLPIGGEEIKRISCLLPRKSKKGKLYAAPVPVARTVVVAAQEAKPTPDASNPTSSNARPVYKNPPRQTYPKDVLKHAFTPYGAGFGQPGAATRAKTPTSVEMDVEEPTAEISAAPKDKGESKKSTTGKKRKGEEEASPKKPKKVKTAS